MYAAVLRENNQVNYEEIEDRELGSKEVRVKVKAAGVCGSDIHKLQSRWKYGFPAVMGHEFSGEIIEKGKDVSQFEIGENVTGIPFLPCYNCEFCETGNYSLCENYEMIGSHYYGGFAENVVLPENNVLSMEGLSFEEASMIEPLAVAMHGVMGIEPELGDIVVVFGVGNIGMLAIQLLKLNGVENVIAVDVKPEKLKSAKYFGADFTINSIEEDLVQKVMEFTGDKGADIALECAGTPVTQEQCLRVVKKTGKIGYLGIAYKDVKFPENSFEKIFRHELTIKGFWNSYSAPFPGKEWKDGISFVKQGRINPKDMISHRYPLRDADKAFDMILNGNEIHNKVMILPDKEF